MKHNLTGMRILVTRPKPQGIELCNLIQQSHGIPLYLPTIVIVPLKITADFVKQLLTFDWWVFTSQHAVVCGLPLLQQISFQHETMPRLAAVGASTAKLLEQEKLVVSVYPEHNWSSEGLLEADAFQDLHNKKIAIIQGVGGRELLADVFTQRGAHVTKVPVYQRNVPMFSKQDVQGVAAKVDVIVSTSAEGLQNLLLIVGEEESVQLKDIPLIVVSERLLLLALTLQFKKVFLARNASHDAIIDAISQRKD